ncbi:TolC family protein [uncultured Chitinophaga sp.]|uniref:TolC family protein n=1 Tax=uncultured Chitinophaga sp. TaxID=339340 RepID=UPI0025F9EF59|nr:TolC family protein [uncultured Chitinophaga sp.]
MFHFRKMRWLCSWLLISFCVPSAAQQPVLTLKELLIHVDRNAPSLVADSAAIRIRQAQEVATRGNSLPSLKVNYQVNAGTNNNMPGGYFSYGIVPGNSRVRIEDNASTALGDLGIAAFDWEVYNFGAYEAQRMVASSDLHVEQARFGQSRYEWHAYTIENYLQLLRLNELVKIQLQTIQRNTEIRRSIQAQAKSGIIAGVDTSIAVAELSRARLNYLELSNQYRQIQLGLSAISGLTPDLLVPDTALAAKLILFNKTVSIQETDTAHHPNIELYKSMYRNSLDKERLVRKSYSPKISLQGAVWGRGSSISASDEFRSLNKGLGFERGNYLVGVGITYNVFDFKRRHMQLSVQEASTEYAKRKLDEQRSLLVLGINKTDADLQTALQRLEEIPHLLNAAQAAYRQKFSLYRNGLTNIVELNAAQNTLYRAEIDYTNAHYLYCKVLFQKALNEHVVDEVLNNILN